VAGVIMLPLLLRHGFAGVRARDAALLALTGGLGFALCAYTGFSLAPASHGAVLIHGALPLFSFALAWLAGAPAASGLRAIGLTGILIGIGAMAWDSLSASTGRQLVGDGFLILASISWSAYGLLVRRIGLAPSHSGSIIAVLSMLCYLPVYAMLPGKAILAASWQELLIQATVQGALVGALGIFIYGRAVASLGAVGTAIFAAAVPCVTTVGAIFLLGEFPSVLAIAGVLIVTVGMAISMKG
jgi:drug/metabolite transporter (DMT)-like permease